MVKIIGLFVFCLFFPILLIAQADDTVAILIAKSNELGLSEHKTWLKLGHYETALPFSTKYKSSIKTEDFFVSNVGRIDPKSELIETLKAFVDSEANDLDSHAQCKFRGRFFWLDQQLDFDSVELNRITCPQFDDWTSNGTTTSISLVFATGYLGNPASYYGHTLIKLNSSQLAERTQLEDVTVNYGAIIPPNEGAIPYILKGLIGGYNGGFSHIQYYFHDYNYGENELRDLWEYQLNLEQEEVNLILGHTWEVMGKEYTYYFLNKNCAYQMAKIFEVIEGLSLAKEFSIWLIPQTFVRNLYNSKIRGESLIKQVIYQPSRQSRLYNKYVALVPAQKDLVHSISDDITLLESDSFNDIEFGKQIEIIDTLTDYYQYVRNEDEFGADINNQHYSTVLAKRFILDPGNTELVATIPPGPHEGRNPSMVGISTIHSKIRGQGFRVNLRPAYYDSLDAGSTHIKNAELKMGELTLTKYDSDIYLQRLELFSVKSVQGEITGLPGDNPTSWSIRAAAEQEFLDCSDCLVSRVEAEYGFTKNLGTNFLIGSTAGASVHDNRLGIGNFSALWSTFLNAHLGERFTMGLRIEKSYDLNGQKKIRNRQTVESRYRITRNAAIRLAYSKDRTEEFGVSFDYYF